MGDVRDPERDQVLPKPGKLPVQAILMGAIRERAEYGRRKYGTVLMTENGRDALTDLWEELLDGLTYLTQLRLERGDVFPGMEDALEALVPGREADEGDTARRRRLLAELIPASCKLCSHEPHRPGECTRDSVDGRTNCMCGIYRAEHERNVEESTCPACLHAVHPGDFCGVRQIDGPCPCEVGPRRRC